MLAGPKIYDKLLGTLVPAVEDIKVGGAFEEDVAVGSMISKEQLERVEGFVERAQEAGAEVLTGGKAMGGDGLLSTRRPWSRTRSRTTRSSSARCSGPS